MRLALLALLFLVGCQSTPPPPPPSPPPGTWYSYGGNEPVVSNNSFAFPGSSGVAGYFYTKIPASAGQALTLNYTITGNNPVWQQHPQPGGTDTNPASMTLFLWRQGDDLGGGAKASYRFWCPLRAILSVGSHVLGCQLDGNVWTNVNGKTDVAGFWAALSNALGLGFTFGGSSFYGHGVYLSSGTATFKIDSFGAQ
jgi:hypothetical protein